MNRKETLALYAKGKDAWNAWASEMLSKYEEMRKSGKWSVEDGLYLEPKNRATRRWLNAAKADFSTEKEPQTFAQKMDFSGFTFPSTALFHFATFEKDAWFVSARFLRRAWFLATQFSGAALFEAAEFKNDAMFERATFSKNAQFDAATLSAFASFGETMFSEEVTFENTTFSGTARFNKAQFRDSADFERSRFLGDALFDDATFDAFADFRSSTFSTEARFNPIEAAGELYFDRATFGGETSFGGRFEGHAEFTDANFNAPSNFECVFSDGVDFGNAVFHDFVVFEGTGFYEDSGYTGGGFVKATFKREALFYGNWFARANFDRATFLDVVSFDNATFETAASFTAIHCEREFSLANTHFQVVPDFIQAHFSEAPRLDNIDVRPRFITAGKWWAWPWRATSALYKRVAASDPSIPARWRALKRLAKQAHDHEREQAFFAMELRSARFISDWPLPLIRPRLTEKDAERQLTSGPVHQGVKLVPFVFWRPSSWAGFFRFWTGLLYQIASDFGRSVARPVILWGLVTSAATLFYLGQSPDAEARRTALQNDGSVGAAEAYVTTATSAWRDKQPCIEGVGTAVPARAKTNAADEALFLALRNGLVVFDGGNDASYRTYGCLYGFDKSTDKMAPVVPSAVSFASLIQKLISSVAIFLLGLGLRNMLRLR